MNPDLELVMKALRIALKNGKLTVSRIQRSLKVGYPTAARTVDFIHSIGLASGPNGSKARDIYYSKKDLEHIEAAFPKPARQFRNRVRKMEWLRQAGNIHPSLDAIFQFGQGTSEHRFLEFKWEAGKELASSTIPREGVVGLVINIDAGFSPNATETERILDSLLPNEEFENWYLFHNSNRVILDKDTIWVRAIYFIRG